MMGIRLAEMERRLRQQSAELAANKLRSPAHDQWGDPIHSPAVSSVKGAEVRTQAVKALTQASENLNKSSTISGSF